MAWYQSQDDPERGDCDDCQECQCYEEDKQCDDCRDCDCHNKKSNKEAINQWNTKLKGADMNRTVAKLFETTADAMLVNKFYGPIIADNDVSYIALKDSADDILAAAKVKQEEEDERNKR